MTLSELWGVYPKLFFLRELEHHGSKLLAKSAVDNERTSSVCSLELCHTEWQRDSTGPVQVYFDMRGSDSVVGLSLQHCKLLDCEFFSTR